MKVFVCGDCGSQRFWRRIVMEHIVDWSREGTPGCPRIEGGVMPSFPIEFVCVKCGHKIGNRVAGEMEETVK